MAHTPAGRRTAVGLLVVAALGGLASCGSDDRPDAAAPKAISATDAPHPQARLKAAFAPFRSPPEGVPTGVTSTMSQSTDGADWRLAQRLSSTDSATIWAVPWQTRLCLVRQDAADGAVSASCMPVARAIDHGVVLTTLAAVPRRLARANRTIVGLVPDGTRRVRVQTPGFGSATSPVTDNTFTMRDAATEPPENVTPLLRALSTSSARR